MAVSRYHTWLFEFAFLFVFAGCSPGPTDEHRRAAPEIELPPEFASTGASAKTVVPQTEDLGRASWQPKALTRSDTTATTSPMPLPQATAERTVMGQAAPKTAEAMATQSVSIPDFRSPSTVRPLMGKTRHDAIDPGAFYAVDVLYATDRAGDSLALDAYQLTGQRQLVSILGLSVLGSIGLCVVAWFFRRHATVKLSGGLAVVLSVAAGAVFLTGSATIEKHGVTYTGGRGQLVRGVCHVTIPKTHTRGSVERPSLLKFEVAENQAKHIVLTRVSELPTSVFEERLSEELAGANEPDLLVFIHGYNVDFESAVMRTAQIAVDLPFEGVPICYSWPSQGTLLGYPVDENNAAWTVGHLKEFLTDLVDRSGARSIHVVAHSMGNRAMTAAMQQIAYQRPDNEPIFDRVVLAAPDVDADLFRKDLAGSLIEVAKKVTLYASSDDQALMASKKVHGYPRAGESGDLLVVVPGVETIDVSGIDLSLLGHSYYGESEPILKDLRDVLFSRLPAPERSSLTMLGHAPRVWWQLSTEAKIATGPRL